MQGNAILSQLCKSCTTKEHTHHRHTYREITVHVHLHKGTNCFIDLPESKLVGLVTTIVAVEVTKEKRLQNIKKR